MGNKSRVRCTHPGCEKTFYNRYNLKRHAEIKHLGLRRFVCSLCGRSLSSQQTLDEHNNMHTGRTPYVCLFEGCGQRFKQASLYSVHKKGHQNQVCREAVQPNEVGGVIRPSLESSPVPQRLALPPIGEPQFNIVLPNIFEDQ